MSTKYVARCYCATRRQWMAFLEVDTQAEADTQASSLMDLIAYDDKAESSSPWTLVEVATTDAHATILRQWVGTGTGYHRVRGRDSR